MQDDLEDEGDATKRAPDPNSGTQFDHGHANSRVSTGDRDVVMLHREHSADHSREISRQQLNSSFDHEISQGRNHNTLESEATQRKKQSFDQGGHRKRGQSIINDIYSHLSELSAVQEDNDGRANSSCIVKKCCVCGD